MPTVLIACDKFKGSLTAKEVAASLSRGLRRGSPDVVIRSVPVADGGEGTLAAAFAAGFDQVPMRASGPTGDLVETSYARRDDVAVVELADVSGLGRLPGGLPAPLTASTIGAGEVIAEAITSGCTHIVLGIGGSSSTDGSTGLVRALGARLLDRDRRDLQEGGATLTDLAQLDLAALYVSTAGVTFTVACDVDNPLTGPAGAAAVYGPQKGASEADVRQLDSALARWADVIAARTKHDCRSIPGAGAAGGVGFAALALLGAELRPGIELVLEFAGFDDLLADADLVVTGEGSLDEQTLRGKAAMGVVAACRIAAVPVVVTCGRNLLKPARREWAGMTSVYSLGELEPDTQRCVDHAAALLEQLGERIATNHLSSRPPVRRGNST